jgi:hypothetical protein
MAGRVGRNRAWNKLPVEVHVQRGTYRADRHGALPIGPSKWAGILPTGDSSTPPPPSWAPDPADVAALGAEGRRFMTAVLDEFVINFLQGTVLLEAARTLDGLVTWRADASDPASARLALAHTKLFSSLVAQLGQLGIR